VKTRRVFCPGLASSVSLCARMKLCVSQCATCCVYRRRFPRQCTVHVDDSKCNGPKTLSRRRSFLSVMLCDFLTAGRHARHTVQAFSILRHPRDPLFSFPAAEFTILSITGPNCRTARFEYSFLSSVCAVYLRRLRFFYLPLFFTCFLEQRRVLRHPSFFLQHLALDFKNTQRTTVSLMTDLDSSHQVVRCINNERACQDTCMSEVVQIRKSQLFDRRKVYPRGPCYLCQPRLVPRSCYINAYRVYRDFVCTIQCHHRSLST
jgi:hypothetical protein